MKTRNSKIETRTSPQFSIIEVRITAVIVVLTALLVGCRSKAPSVALDFFPGQQLGAGLGEIQRYTYL